MKTLNVSLPEFGFVAATRGLAGAGIGLLVGPCLTARARKSLGWTLVALGVITTVPIAKEVISRSKQPAQ